MLWMWIQKTYKIQKVINRNNIFVTKNEGNRIKEQEMREIMEEYGEVKKTLKLWFYPNNKLNEAIICLSTEEEAYLAITEINT